MFTFRHALGLTVPLVALQAGLGCSPSTGGTHGIDPAGGSSGASGTTGAIGGTGGSTGGGVALGGTGGSTGGAVSMGGMGGSTMPMAGSGGTDTCAAMFTPGMPVPVDVYVMLDISGSMLDPAGGAGSTMTKWTAVQAALTAFFADASSAGLSVAIQYFPQRVPGVPTSCMSDTDCGMAAPCLLNICQQFPDGLLVSCAGDPDCAAMNIGKCIPYGNCEADATLSCGVANPGKPQAGCGPDGMPGLCLPATSSFCVHETLCTTDTYKAPAVDYLTLPDTASALTTSITAQMPIGDTPSVPALTGAIGHARERAAANVGHSQVVLFATDGMPTLCTDGPQVSGEIPSVLDQVVTVATEGYTPAMPNDASVTTFVIGVFAEGDATAQTNLDRIAKAGGSEHAYVISSGQDVQQQFLAALATIRQSRVGCEFLPPPAPPGQKLDFNSVNVDVDSASGVQHLVNVVPTGCTGMTDEWHYDCDVRNDPTGMCKPTKLIACPKTCENLSKVAANGVTVGLGCKTTIR